MVWVRLLCLLVVFSGSNALDNGLALTPPMGWLSWERFVCNTNCTDDPKNCISESLYMEMADRLASDGFKECGYEYVNIDDCWMAETRDKDGKLQADPVRFPHGIKYIADYVHSKGLKLGIYEDSGPKTCAGYPGSAGHFDIDAQTFADWGVDMLKVDGCNVDPKDMDDLYPQLTIALNKTGRPIVYSCSWPAYQVGAGMKPNYTKIAENCNLWRNFDDIEDSWASVLSIVDFYASQQKDLVPAAGPGHWNDPDMILAGNFGLSYEEAKAQFALWAIMASPLLMSNDLRALSPEFKQLLTNKEVIDINQDALGLMGKRVYSKQSVEVWMRQISPTGKSKKSAYALAVLNRRTLGGPIKVSIGLKSIGMESDDCYELRDVFLHKDIGTFCPTDNVTVVVNPSGVTMVVARSKL